MASKRPLAENISEPAKGLRRRFTGMLLSQPERQSSSSYTGMTNANPPLPVDPLTAPASAANDTRSTVWAGLVTALRGLEKASNVFHSLNPAVSALVDCLDILPVSDQRSC
jgi:hypothetical protein